MLSKLYSISDNIILEPKGRSYKIGSFPVGRIVSILFSDEEPRDIWSETPHLKRRGILKGKEGDSIPSNPWPQNTPP
jgi:hypothetical protein